jgi:hypothetical protein
MKQAVLITAHTEINHLKQLIKSFDNDFVLYIHIDKRSRIPKHEIDAIKNYRNVVFISRKYNVNWGGTNYLECILLLANESIKNSDIEYIHLLSGQDFPLKSCDYIKNYLTVNHGKEFLNYFVISHDPWGIEDVDEWISRIHYYHFYDLFNARSKYGAKLIYYLLRAQQILQLKRDITGLPKLYGGSAWWTLSYSCLKYVVDYTKSNLTLLKRFKYTCSPEEVFFHTIIMNSPFMVNVENNNLRYVDWKFRNGHIPANLDENDYETIINSDAFFARKFQYPISQKLVDRLKKYITT